MPPPPGALPMAPRKRCSDRRAGPRSGRSRSCPRRSNRPTEWPPFRDGCRAVGVAEGGGGVPGGQRGVALRFPPPPGAPPVVRGERAPPLPLDDPPAPAAPPPARHADPPLDASGQTGVVGDVGPGVAA